VLRGIPQRLEYQADPSAARSQQAREDLARWLAAVPFLQGRLVSVTFANGVRKEVRHGLGGAAACIVVRQNYDSGSASVRVAEHGTRATDETTHLALVADAACTLDLWFYPRASKTIDAGQGQSL
jgi:hypothetical protein